MLAELLPISTGRSAPDYPPGMRITTAILPALLLVLAAANCKGDDTPENVPGDFGEPCTPGAGDDTPDGCVSGLKCYSGYCEESCVKPEDCRVLDGWEHACIAGQCAIRCSAAEDCPSDLGTSLVCKDVGGSKFCEAADDP